MFHTDERERRVLLIEYMCPLMRTRGIIMEEKQLAIHVEGLNKVYKLYDHNRDRLVDSLGLSRKKKYREHLPSGAWIWMFTRGNALSLIHI